MGDLGGQAEAGVVAQAVVQGHHAREDGGVGWQGQGGEGVRLAEQGALRCDAVHGGRLRQGVSIGAHAVGPQGVDGDEEDVGRALPGSSGGLKLLGDVGARAGKQEELEHVSTLTTPFPTVAGMLCGAREPAGSRVRAGGT